MKNQCQYKNVAVASSGLLPEKEDRIPIHEFKFTKFKTIVEGSNFFYFPKANGSETLGKRTEYFLRDRKIDKNSAVELLVAYLNDCHSTGNRVIKSQDIVDHFKKCYGGKASPTAVLLRLHNYPDNGIGRLSNNNRVFWYLTKPIEFPVNYVMKLSKGRAGRSRLTVPADNVGHIVRLDYEASTQMEVECLAPRPESEEPGLELKMKSHKRPNLSPDGGEGSFNRIFVRTSDFDNDSFDKDSTSSSHWVTVRTCVSGGSFKIAAPIRSPQKAGKAPKSPSKEKWENAVKAIQKQGLMSYVRGQELTEEQEALWGRIQQRI